jgi:N-methylhydantoinase A/oxoprolinase/acetone carboxylase beta subunit
MIIGLDVGGTHTDAVLLYKGELIHHIKVPTDSADLLQTVLKGLEGITADIDPGDIRRAVLSTTLATNLVAQQNLPPAGMVVSAGPGIDPQHFRTNAHYHIVSGALDHRGREVQPLDEQQIRSVGERFKQEGIRYAGVVSKFSVRNPEHEKRMAALLEPYVEKVFLGNDFSGALNFPRRIATTYLNAAVYPVHKAFFQAVQQSLNQKGLDVPIRILKPDGGNMNFASSVDHAAQTILSGPSASVMGAVAHAPGEGSSLVLDIGGTTTDMAVLIDAVPLLAPSGIEIGPYKTLIRALLTRSLAIGGDSETAVENGELSIGPGRKGPAMAFGGPAPTPTDACCVLGLLTEGDRERAIEGLKPLADELNLSVEATAARIFESACRTIVDGAQTMIDEINSKPVYTVHELWEGSRIIPKHFIILGGPAPQFAEKLAALFDGKVTVVPHWQVANAIGCALARTTCEVSLFADTAQGTATAPGENFSRNIGSGFDLQDACDLCIELLKAKALRRGAIPENLNTEILEASEFNMVRGFSTVGKNLRVRAQVKPGLIQMP